MSKLYTGTLRREFFTSDYFKVTVQFVLQMCFKTYKLFLALIKTKPSQYQYTVLLKIAPLVQNQLLSSIFNIILFWLFAEVPSYDSTLTHLSLN